MEENNFKTISTSTKKIVMKSLVGVIVLAVILGGLITFCFDKKQNRNNVILSTVNIQDAKILSQKENTFQLYFNFSNKEIIQSGVKYGVRLVQDTSDGQVIVDEKVYPDTLTIPEQSVEGKILTYTAPENIGGEYTLFVTAQNEKGFSLGLASVGVVTLHASGKEVVVVPGSCFLTVADDTTDQKYTLTQGVDINPDESLILNCLVVNPSSSAVVVSPTFNTYRHTIYGEKTEQTAEFTPAIDFKAKEEKVVSVFLPKVATPQNYEIVTSFSSQTGTSNSVTVRYALRGVGATIVNTWFDKPSYQKGDTAHVSFLWGLFNNGTWIRSSKLSSIDDTRMLIKIALVDDQGKKCTDTFMKRLSDSSRASKVQMRLPVIENCINPTIVGTIVDRDGNTLDTIGGITKMDGGKTDGIYVKTNLGLSIGIFIVLLIVIVLYSKKRQRDEKNLTSATKAFIFALLILTAGNVMPTEVKAVTFCASDIYAIGPDRYGSSCSPVTINFDKSSYTPSSPISVTTSITSPMNNSLDYVVVQGTIRSGSSDSYDVVSGSWTSLGNTSRGSGSTVVGMTAPSSVGTWHLKPRTTIQDTRWDYPSEWGRYDPIALITVGSAVSAPTSATITLSPSTVLTTQTFTASWSGNNSPTSYKVRVNSTDYDMGAATSWSGTPVDLSLGVGNHNFYAMACNSGGCSPWSPVKVLTVTVATPAPTLTFTASPTSITAGSSSNLSWSTTNATSCSASGDWSGSKTTSGGPVSTGTLSTVKTYTYTLTCSGPGGSVSQNATVVVSAMVSPPTLSFTASPTSVTVGSSSTLTWVTANVTSCSASGDWSGSKTASGGSASTGALNTVKTYTYTLTCSGPGGSVTKNATVMVTSVISAPTLSLTASPTSVTVGSSSTLTWVTANVTSCSASGDWSGSKTTSGGPVSTGTLNIVRLYTYTLTCSGPGGSVTRSATVNVIASSPASPTLTFTASPTSITAGSSSNLSWSTTNATSCSASGDWSGSKTTSGGPVSTGTLSTVKTYTYTLTCSGPGGSVSKNATVVVSASMLPATISFTPPSAVFVGSPATASWTTTNATYVDITCTLGPGIAQSSWAESWLAPNSSKTVVAVGGMVGSTHCNVKAVGPGGDSPSVPFIWVVNFGSATCGDSVCTKPAETKFTCPIDCESSIKLF